MNIKTNVYDEFQCVGSECLCNCCHGWTVLIDDATAEYYKNIKDDFGVVLNSHLEYQESLGWSFRLGCDEACVALDSEGLCSVYKNLGEEHMSIGCKQFPRLELTLDQKSYFLMLSSECEQVIRLLYEMREDLRLQIDTTKSPETHQEIILFEFAQFCAWAMELIQNKDIPLGVALSTCLYLSLDLREILKKGDYDELWKRIDGVPSLIAEFMSLREECSQSSNVAIWGQISEIIEYAYYDAIQKDKADKSVITEIQPFFWHKTEEKFF